MSSGNLRYYGLAAYTALVALWTGTGQIVLDQNTGIALLAPIALIIGVDYAKHKNDTG